MTLFGPVFEADLALQGRRTRTYVLRVAALSLLLLALAATYVFGGHFGKRLSTGRRAAFGRQVYTVLASIELSFVLCMAPAMAAGALVNDRVRGTLEHAFVTDLSDREIVYGKWAARTLPLLTLVVGSFPILWICSSFGGISAAEVLKLYAVLVGCSLLLTSFCMFASLLARRTSDVMVACLAATALWSLLPMMERIAVRNFAPTASTDFASPFGWVFGIPAHNALPMAFVLALLLPAAALGMLESAARVLRWSASRRLGAPSARRAVRRGAEPDLDARPVEWLEWARNRRSLAHWLTMGMLTAFCGIGLLATALAVGRSGGGPGVVAFASMAFGLTGALLFTSVGAAAQCTDDRQNGWFEMLGATTLEPTEVQSGRSGRIHQTTKSACILVACFAAVCAFQSLRIGFLCGLTIAANYFGFARMFVAVGNWSALTFRRQIVGIGAAVGAFLLLTAAWPAVVASRVGTSHRSWALMQTGPFFSFVLSGRLGIEPGFLGDGAMGMGNVLWSLCVAATTYAAGAFIDVRNRRLLEKAMRNGA